MGALLTGTVHCESCRSITAHTLVAQSAERPANTMACSFPLSSSTCTPNHWFVSYGHIFLFGYFLYPKVYSTYVSDIYLSLSHTSAVCALGIFLFLLFYVFLFILYFYFIVCFSYFFLILTCFLVYTRALCAFRRFHLFPNYIIFSFNFIVSLIFFNCVLLLIVSRQAPFVLSNFFPLFYYVIFLVFCFSYFFLIVSSFLLVTFGASLF